MNILSLLILALLSIKFCEAQYEDARCKCVCDNGSVKNVSESNKKVWIRTIPPEKCNCEHMVNVLSPDLKTRCPVSACECKYQSRNTTTMKVVVCLIIAIISSLTLYMIFLLLLEPLLAKRRSGLNHSDSPGNPDARAPPYRSLSHLSEGSSLGSVGDSGGNRVLPGSEAMSDVMSRARNQQKRWKGNVEAQRARVYSEHSILN